MSFAILEIYEKNTKKYICRHDFTPLYKKWKKEKDGSGFIIPFKTDSDIVNPVIANGVKQSKSLFLGLPPAVLIPFKTDSNKLSFVIARNEAIQEADFGLLRPSQ